MIDKSKIKMKKCSTIELIIYVTIVIIIIFCLINFTKGGENFQGSISQDMINDAIDYISSTMNWINSYGPYSNIDMLEKMRYKLADNMFIFESDDNLITQKKISESLIRQLDKMIENKIMQQMIG